MSQIQRVFERNIKNKYKKNGTIMLRFQDSSRVLTNAFADYQLLKPRGRPTKASFSSRRFIPRTWNVSPSLLPRNQSQIIMSFQFLLFFIMMSTFIL